MNYKQFLGEAPRAEPLARTQDTAAKKEFRAGDSDLGAVDRYTQIDKDKSKTVTRRRAGNRNAVRRTKRDYSQPDQYVDRTARQMGEVPAAPDASEVRYSGRQATPAAAERRRNVTGIGGRLKRTAQRKGTYDGSEIEGAPVDTQGLSARFRPSNEKLKKADDDNIKATRDAFSPLVGDNIKVPGLDRTVGRYAGLRHNQPAGVGLSKSLDNDDIKYIIGAIADTDPQRKAKNRKFGNSNAPQPEDKTGIEDTKQRRQTGRDIEALSPEAEEEARKTKAYLQDPKVIEYQQKLRDATDNQDAAALQSLVFNHEVTPDAIKQFKSEYGKTSGNINARDTIADRISGAGSTAPMTARYGGDLGPKAKKYEVSPGVYDWTKLPSNLKKQAMENRENAMIETYLKQGGRDAYAAHEGIRSITDMDLEHITSLQGEGRGRDHPENWVFASSQSNRQRGERDLTGSGSAVETLATGKGAGEGIDRSAMNKAKSTYSGLLSRMRKAGKDDEANAIEELTGGRQMFSVAKYKQKSDAERSKIRKALEKGGATPEEALEVVPKAKVGGFKADNDEKGGESYMANPSQYDRDTQIDDSERMSRNEAIDEISKLPQYAGLSRNAIKDTFEYKQFMKKLRGEPTETPEDDEDDF